MRRLREFDYTDDDLRKAVNECISLRAVQLQLTGDSNGAARRSVIRRIKDLHIDTSHFLGRSHARGTWLSKHKPPLPKIPLEELLSYSTKRRGVKDRLFFEGLKEKKCEWCELTTWRGLPIPLELDHIDGDILNNHLENLRILCPNCHAQTPTYRGKNIKLKRLTVSQEVVDSSSTSHT